MDPTTDSHQHRHAGHGVRTTRLHGHRLDTSMSAVAVTEAVGTFVLVLAITSVAVAGSLSRPVAGVPYGSLAVPIAGGLALVLLVASLGPISGAHFNPAVTLGLAANGRFPWRYTPVYVISQFAGAIGAAAVVWSLYGESARSKASLGATFPAPGVPVWRVLVTEAIVTFILVLVVVSVATDARVSRGAAAGAIGTALAVAILISGPLTGAGVNPARAVGPMIVAGKFTDWWAYVVAPVVGGVAAVALYERFLRRANLTVTTS